MTQRTRIPVLRIHQWLESWDDAEWSEHLPQPSPHFFVASVSLATLRRLAGVSKRHVTDRKDGGQGAGYQRAHQPQRSRNIARYLRYGYPISNERTLEVSENRKLIHPGWLPTAILVNVVGPQETRRRAGEEKGIKPGSEVYIEQDRESFFLNFPADALSADFKIPASSLEPLEIIDGQHRLFAVDELSDDFNMDNYEVPVVFFDGLTPSWQAYLFWVINVEPKKINPSLAYDLYPELRNQSWLQSGEGIKVYQEHRAQELTEVLWRHKSSPWRERIELHGQRVDGHVSNAAFIRALMVSFVRRWGEDFQIGGLFGSIGSKNMPERVLPWKRSQQAAFLIACWHQISEAVVHSTAPWVRVLSRAPWHPREGESHLHAAFAGPNTLLATDQGVRTILVVLNALFQINYAELDLETWESENVSDTPEDEDVTYALSEFKRFRKANSFLREISENIINNIDWRTSSAPGLSEHEKLLQSSYRGSSGYVQLRNKCLESLQKSGDARVAMAASTAAELLGR